MECYGLPPVISLNSRVLILGTMPSKESLKHKQYYANPRNHFWPIISSILGKPMSSAYSERIACLLEYGIALWDVLASCDRLSSSDKDIRNVVVNDCFLQEGIPHFCKDFSSGTGGEFLC